MSNKGKMAALERAMQLELDGRKFYLQAAEKTDHELGRKMFNHLAKEELRHMERIKEVHGKLTKGEPWPKVPTSHGLHSDIFTEAKGQALKGSTTDLKAIKIGLEMEEQSFDLYDRLAEEAKDPFEKRFFISLSHEERGHYLTLLDAQEYLTDPEAWLERTEKILLDGA